MKSGRNYVINMSYEIQYLPLAEQDLEDIAFYLSQFYPSTLKKFMNMLEKHISNLQDMPHMGTQYGDYHKLVALDYLVFYKILEEQNLIKIYRVLHGARGGEIKKMG